MWGDRSFGEYMERWTLGRFVSKSIQIIEEGEALKDNRLHGPLIICSFDRPKSGGRSTEQYYQFNQTNVPQRHRTFVEHAITS